MVIPVGTRFSVTRVFNQDWGEKGRYWLLYGRLLDSDLTHKEFIVPSGNYTQSGQIWISPASPDADKTPIRLLPNFVKPCA